MDVKLRTIVIRAIARPGFVFRFDTLNLYWATIATSTRLWVRDALEHVGDGRIAPCIFSLLVTRWAGEPVKLLKRVCQVLVSNLVFSAILMSAGAYRGRIRNSEDVKNVADNFEAYVAAYARQFGTRRLKSWVFRAFGPLVDTIRPECCAVLSPVLIRSPHPQPEIDDIEAALTRLVRSMPNNPRHVKTQNIAGNGTMARKAPVFPDTPSRSVKRKNTKDNEPSSSSKKAKLDAGPSISLVASFNALRVDVPTVLKERTNGQGSVKGRSTKRSTPKRKPQPSDASSALFVTMPDLPHPTPASSYLPPPSVILQGMQCPVNVAHYPQVLPTPALPQQSTSSTPPASWSSLSQAHPAVFTFSSSSHMPWWTSSGIFASAMDDIGFP
ncbi:hypothetical protein B0H15DRAFT_1027805 [Mycena belliarum]|uniref:Uncharacterized protein n=1 Tax=Mycena belliarum TaxID=1033014 RepID=A0AAD6TP80_9AGAR|nr:hypothetical protein B0H15DRAFT_1027805 [Mycena belliae]